MAEIWVETGDRRVVIGQPERQRPALTDETLEGWTQITFRGHPVVPDAQTPPYQLDTRGFRTFDAPEVRMVEETRPFNLAEVGRILERHYAEPVRRILNDETILLDRLMREGGRG